MSPFRLALPILGALALAPAPGASQAVTPSARDSSRDRTAKTVGAPRDKLPRWRALHANEFQTPWTTFRIGGGFLVDLIGYDQSADNRQQVAGIGGEQIDPEEPADFVARASDGQTPAIISLPTVPVSSISHPGSIPTAGRVRDSRIIFSGRLATDRRISWQAGFMYDWLKSKWFVRQTGLLVAVPEIYSTFWIGRSKQGTSLNRVMVGYDGWTMERFPMSDAAIPLLADGIRWIGYLPRANLFWNLGVFDDYWSEGQTFSYFDNQVAGRFGYVRMESDTAGSLLHIGLGFQNGIPNDATLHLKSKPEATTAPNFVDTGKFPATLAQLLGYEAYYRDGPWLFGSEYYFERARSPETGNPVFQGGDIFASWVITGETRRYVVPGSTFLDVSPAHSVYHGGGGAVEVLLRLSYTDLTAGTLEGGTFWRITPAANWYLSDEIRLELGYGYGVLDRFGIRGRTQFFQSRIQLQL
ncbi:MAG: porin [Gemmatimonadaceae bacterium]